MSEPKTIGSTKYFWLKGLSPNALSEEDIAKIREFEETWSPVKPEDSAFYREYNKKLLQKPENRIPECLDPSKVGEMFIKIWANMFPNDQLELTGEMKNNLRTLTYYFSNDERFYDGCESELSLPDINKGMMIIGKFGNGKTSSMDVFNRILCAIPGYSFRSYTTTDVVDEWEACSKPEDKQKFWKKFLNGRIHFDDVLREREASNYGKMELFRDILLKRYDAQRNNPEVKTFITCNPLDSNLESALDHFTQKYGEIVYDRLFQMFNIMFWHGKSFRR